MIKTTYILLLLICIASCGLPGSSDMKLEGLYRQRIPHSKYVMYDFSFSGPMAWSSDFNGRTILDSSKRFSEKGIHPLPTEYVNGKLRADTLKLVSVIGTEPAKPNDTSLQPVRVYSKEFSGVIVEVTEYRETYGSAITAGLMEFKFNSVKETEDSLIFFGVRHVYGSIQLRDTAAFCKGNIHIVDSADYIKYIRIDKVIVQRGEIYKPTKPLELVANQPIVGIVSLWFYPQKITLSNELSEIGIYKAVR